MTSPVPDADAAEQRRTADGSDTATDRPSLRDTAAEADLVEQAQPAGPAHDQVGSEPPLEADPADAADQAAAVPLDEDEGRDDDEESRE